MARRAEREPGKRASLEQVLRENGIHSHVRTPHVTAEKPGSNCGPRRSDALCGTRLSSSPPRASNLGSCTIGINMRLLECFAISLKTLSLKARRSCKGIVGYRIRCCRSVYRTVYRVSEKQRKVIVQRVRLRASAYMGLEKLLLRFNAASPSQSPGPHRDRRSVAELIWNDKPSRSAESPGQSATRRTSSQVNNPTLDGRRRRLRPVIHAQLAEYALDMILHRVLSDAQLVRDLFIAVTFDDQREHVHLAAA